jgi:hypothetical protein
MESGSLELVWFANYLACLNNKQQRPEIQTSRARSNKYRDYKAVGQE